MSITEKLVSTGGKNVASWPVPVPGSRESRLRDDLTRRLASVCSDLSSPDFEGLVQQMTREQLRGERVIGRVFGHNLTLAKNKALPGN